MLKIQGAETLGFKRRQQSTEVAFMKTDVRRLAITAPFRLWPILPCTQLLPSQQYLGSVPSFESMAATIASLMKPFHFLLLGLLAIPAFAWTKSGNQYTTNGLFPDVLAASRDSALADGDVINIPAGTFTGWGASFTAVNLNKAITLKGAGQALTTLVLDPTGPNSVYGAIQFYSSNATVSDLTITGSSSNSVNPFAASAGSHLDNIRITRVTYNAEKSDSYFLFGQDVYGVVDHCTINGGAGNAELFFIRGATNAYQTAKSAGTVNALYIENNTFGGSGYVSDFNSNSRGVIRYNTITVPGMKIDAHGMDSNSPARSFREIEVYRNTFTNGGAEAVAIRGGTGFLFDNKVTNTNPTSCWFQLINYGAADAWPNYGTTNIDASAANPTVITTRIPHGYTTGYMVHVTTSNGTPTINGDYVATVTGPNTFTIPVDVTVAATSTGWTARTRTPADYPTYDQVGRGRDASTVYTNASDPFYLWNNTAQGGADWTLNWKAVSASAISTYRIQTNNPSATFAMKDMIVADRDYFKQTVGGPFDGSSGVGRGTTAQMNAITASKTGVGFWVTDQGGWNQSGDGLGSGILYTWNGSAWVQKYTPYTYPHPLQGGASVAPHNALIQIR